MASSGPVGGFDPLKFVRGFIDNSEEEASELLKGIEGVAYANITKCFNPENAARLKSALTPAQIAAFKARISLLTASSALSRAQVAELRSILSRVDTILARTPIPPSKTHHEGSHFVAHKRTPQENGVVASLVSEANKILAANKKAFRMTEATIMEHISCEKDGKIKITPEGYASLHIPLISRKNKDGEIETLQLFVQVDRDGKPTGDVEVHYFSKEARKFF